MNNIIKYRKQHFFNSRRFFRAIVTILFAIVLIVADTSCKKFLTVPPPKDQIVSSVVFDSDNSATSAMLGIYSSIMQDQLIFSGGMTIDCGLYADEFNFDDASNQFLYSQLTADNPDVNNVWVSIYNYIYGANAVLEGVASSTKVTTPIKNQLLGEAKLIRAFSYFYLTNLYGDVPLITSTNYRANSLLGRSPSLQVYQQIIADLKDAQNLLTADYSFSNGEKVRPNKWAATALLAKVYLYNKSWQDAAEQAAGIINANIFSLTSLSDVFLKNSAESIWQLMPVNSDYNTFEGQSFVTPDSFSKVNYPLTSTFMQSIENGDQRFNNWIGISNFNGQDFYYAYKYKLREGNASQEYYTVFRLAEQYLIRAEALAMLNKLPESVTDINTVRQRAGLTPLSLTLTSTDVLQAIAQERRVELFAEWGNRWFDLKRTGTANAVLGALKPGSWKPTAINWPIPIPQIKANQKLSQNAGY